MASLSLSEDGVNEPLVCLARLVQLSLRKDDVVPPVCFDDGVNCNARLQVSDNLREGVPVLCVQVNADKLPYAVLLAEMVHVACGHAREGLQIAASGCMAGELRAHSAEELCCRLRSVPRV